ncbi:hypothetical protein Kpol_1033p56 [Vanderwaltozyma polyspora DSM 70294]|uniref:RNA polymerase I-specific transcription initiation factor RRN3 n=1 Tax=Vanderwaltozyma polyspora (strain ATCC 22028 / DSM 70294 / BCRC 21397 / CBS 2163 / NBRC 10782 / NRRL Y-8283 / UCD 57-17) TaxID=436907 RepID=A7TJ50_VANPO|nr:uncharacterized protein Kpol_1033p56 [Vanderwaltozyma polyspora DSM 70294]EDO17749.1 hypothetical protein Kpol_1033p56 [Vanderwaltozyma polyspora DSM 70294]
MLAFENSKRPAQNIGKVVESKKRKVEFADEVVFQSPSCEESDDQKVAQTMYRRFVLSALEDLEKNDSTQVDIIASKVNLPSKSSDRVNLDNFKILLEVLSDNISRIDNSKGSNLIQSIINFEKWWELPEPILGKYIFFIKILCSSLPRWWQDVSMVIIVCFNLSPEKTSYHHEMLMYFLRMIPSSVSFIDSYLSRFFPNKNDTRKNLVNYISNILTLTSYCKELRFQAWSLLIERVISLDVELQNELDELDDDIEEDFEEESDDSGEESEHEDEIGNDESDDETENKYVGIEASVEVYEDEDEQEGDEEYNVEVSQSIKELTSKLDAILTLISSRLTEELTPESIESGDGVNIFNTLTTLFKSHILPTYYTRSIQYIMFHISQQQTELMDSFLVTLIDIAFSPNETSEKKVKSLQYLGSYIARAKHLSRTQIVFVASYLTSWLNRYLLEREDEVDQPGGMERFKHFYAAFQSLCYMFCFRHNVFKDVDGKWECELDKFFQRMVISKFNPLKYCNENVMMMFARITQHEGIAYCFGIIETNNNERLRGIIGRSASDKEASGSQSISQASTWSLITRQQFIDLQSYFPFDPLLLKNYKSLMKEYYIEWSEASGEYESDESDD